MDVPWHKPVLGQLVYGFCVVFFNVWEHLKAQVAVVLVLKRLRRQGHTLKSHPTDWESWELKIKFQDHELYNLKLVTCLQNINNHKLSGQNSSDNQLKVYQRRYYYLQNSEFYG